MRTKRLRIFAGPNGSGKSVLYEYLLSQQYFNNYFYINADVITKGLINGFSFSNWPISISESDFFSYLDKSSFKSRLSVSEVKNNLEIVDSVFTWKGSNENLTYISAFIADYVRNLFLVSDSSFTCETVFSHSSKIDFIKHAKSKVFKVYLYFIATKNPLKLIRDVLKTELCLKGIKFLQKKLWLDIIAVLIICMMQFVFVIEYICLTILNQNQSFPIIILRKYVMVNVVFIQILFLIGFFNMFMINYLEK